MALCHTKRLSNGKTLAKDFGRLMTGFYTTSYSGQSKTVDRVLVSAGTEVLRATYLEQFLVAMSRGREGVRVYTDDKDALRERIVHSGQRGSATELMAGQVTANTRPMDVTERATKDRDRLRKRAYRGKYAAVVESQRNRIAVGEGRRKDEWYERLVDRSRQGSDYGR
jgi:ATP-dependent exoDNAse (exonuclease V) alpha subunit